MKNIGFETTKEQLIKQFKHNVSFLDPDFLDESKVDSEIEEVMNKLVVFDSYELDLIEDEEDLLEFDFCHLDEPPKVGDVILSEHGIVFYKSFIESIVAQHESKNPESEMYLSFHELLLKECERVNCL